jgi:hypothetical protein
VTSEVGQGDGTRKKMTSYKCIWNTDPVDPKDVYIKMNPTLYGNMVFIESIDAPV